MAFRRRKKDVEDVEDVESDQTAAETLESGETENADEEFEVAFESDPEPDPVVDDGIPAWPSAGIADRDGGPWDADEVPEDKIERIDLGGVKVPIVSGMELRAEIAEDQVVAVTLILGRSALQLQPFAAPRTIGIWSEIRAEIAGGIDESGGRATEEQGRFGTELVAEVGVTLPDGSTGMQSARFIGVDGPRWFLRAVITGEGAADSRAREPLEDLLGDVVVVRGADAMAPRDPIELRLPEEVEVGEAGEQFDADPDSDDDSTPARSTDDLKPFERGPEITEIR